MLRPKLSAVYFGALLGIVLALGGCGTPPDKTANMSPKALYEDAQDSMNGGQWDKAIPLLDKLEARAAGTPLAQQAQLDKAYAQFHSGEPVDTIVTLDRFIRLQPASPAMDYALYLKGIINFNDDLGIFSSITQQDLTERDQKAAKESLEAFRELRTRFPQSKYAADAGLRINYIVSALAQYEVHVARYYYSRGAYVAAINRAQTAISDYREVKALEEALYILYKSYDALGMVQLRDDTRRILDLNYPQSELVAKGFPTQKQAWWKFW